MKMPRWPAMALVLGLAACLGSGDDDGAPDYPLQPGGYRVSLDGERLDPGTFQTAETPDGIRVTTGPAGIAWRPQDTVSAGDFRAEATLTLMGAPVGYREAYGIFVGGRELGGPWASYLYFMVRASGEFMVKRRIGDATETLLDWTRHIAVQQVLEDGENPVNTLAIEARDGELRFLLNGTVVFLLPLDETEPHGAVGLRVNHRLDVLLTGWSLGPPPPEAPPPTGA